MPDGCYAAAMPPDPKYIPPRFRARIDEDDRRAYRRLAFIMAALFTGFMLAILGIMDLVING